MATTTANSMLVRLHANRGMIFPLACISLLLVLLIPLPPGVLDLLLVANLTLSVLILVTTIYVRSPLEFAVLPSILLSITLFRLVLNVATTRLILSGDGTESSAGEVVRTFSHFVTHGSVTVGRDHLPHHFCHPIYRHHKGREPDFRSGCPFHA